MRITNIQQRLSSELVLELTLHMMGLTEANLHCRPLFY